MVFNRSQVEAIAKHMKEQYARGEIDNVAAVTAVVAAGVSGRLTEEDAYYVLLEIHQGSRMDTLTSMLMARPFIEDKELVDEIVAETEEEILKRRSPETIEKVMQRIREDDDGEGK